MPCPLIALPRKSEERAEKSLPESRVCCNKASGLLMSGCIFSPGTWSILKEYISTKAGQMDANMMWTTGPGPLRVPGQARETSGHLDALCCQGWQNLPDAGQEHGWWWDHGHTLGSAPMHVCTHPGLGRQRMTPEGRRGPGWDLWPGAFRTVPQ